jgi:hypothetical protein
MTRPNAIRFKARATVVTRLSRVIKDYDESGALNARVNITAAVVEPIGL